MYQPPEPSGAGRCLRCASCIDESEQIGGICYECQPAEEGKQPAFPVQASEYAGHGPSHGITIRDYFAAKFAAAQATSTSADSNFINPDYVDPRDGRTVAQKIAATSYALADAMLAARVKP